MNVVDQRKIKFENLKYLRIGGLKNSESKYSAKMRIQEIADEDSFIEFVNHFGVIDPLNFEGYIEKKEKLKEDENISEAYISGVCTISGIKVVIGVMDKSFLMGSMGIELGERVCRSVEYAMQFKLPLIIFTASGGARMQEGILSLMQMAKTSAVIEKYKSEGGLYIVVLTHPTTGGVSASFAMLGDITLAEPDSLIGFAGPRVIEQTIGEKLPEGFQKSNFQMKHGFVDKIVERENMKKTLTLILNLHSREKKITYGSNGKG